MNGDVLYFLFNYFEILWIAIMCLIQDIILTFSHTVVFLKIAVIIMVEGFVFTSST